MQLAKPANNPNALDLSSKIALPLDHPSHNLQAQLETAPSLAQRGAPPLKPSVADRVGDNWRLHSENSITAAIVNAIDGAKQVVNVEFFAFSDAGKGAHLVDALERAAKRGVEVNVFTDATSFVAPPLGSYQRLAKRITDAGGHVLNNVVSRSTLNQTGLPGLRHVDHRKVVSIDGTLGFTGGINFVRLEDNFHDSMVELAGPEAAKLAAEQLIRWRNVGGEVTARHQQAVDNAVSAASKVAGANEDMQIRVNAPDESRFELSEDYLSLIRNAKERIWVSSPGYSDQKLLGELNNAAARGVDVRIIVSGTAPLGAEFINWVTDSHMKELIQHGGSVYEIPETLHRKALLADDQAVLSSFNITTRSRLHDHEIGVKAHDEDFVDAVRSTLAQDIARAKKIEHKDLDRKIIRAIDYLTQKFKISY